MDANWLCEEAHRRVLYAFTRSAIGLGHELSAIAAETQDFGLRSSSIPSLSMRR